MESGLFQSALVALKAGSVDVALSKAKQLILDDSSNAFALVLAADCFNQYGKEKEGLGLIQAAVAASNQDPCFSLIQARQLLRLQQRDQSLACVKSARQLHPHHAGLLLMQFELLCLLRRYTEVRGIIDSHRTQVVKHPDFYSSVIGMYRHLGEHHVALEYAQEWCSDSSGIDALKAMADCWFAAGHHDRYVASVTDASHSYPNDQNLHALRLQAHLDASDKSNLDVLAEVKILSTQADLDPGLALVCARVLLAHSDFLHAWPLYEHRLKLSPTGLYAPVEPVSDPQSSLFNQNVLLVAEQGVGDVLFFARFIPKLLADAFQVVCLVDERLSALLKRCFPELVIVTNLGLAQQLAGDGHLCLAIGSLPMRYATTPDLVKSSQFNSALKPHSALQRFWSESLDKNSMHIGLSLTAGLQAGSYKTDKRSVPLSVVEQLLIDSGAMVHDLQHFCPDELSLPFMRSYVRLTDDLEQLLAFISCLDILVTSDQTNAFLAGILGVPALVIAPPNPHFAFMAEGTITPWFDSLTIVRSSTWQGWDALIPILNKEFQALVSQVGQE